MKGIKWSPEDKQKAWAMRCSGKTLEQIGQALGRPVASVHSCLMLIKRDNEAKKIPCLCCRRLFRSAGAHNRLCPPCARRSVSPFAP